MDEEHIPYWILYEAGKCGESLSGSDHVFRYVERAVHGQPKEISRYSVTFEGHARRGGKRRLSIRHPSIPVVVAERLTDSDEITISVAADRNDIPKKMKVIRPNIWNEEEGEIWRRVTEEAEKIVDLASLYIAAVGKGAMA